MRRRRCSCSSPPCSSWASPVCAPTGTGSWAAPCPGSAPASAAAGPPVATGADEPFWRRHLSPLSRVLLALAVVATPASILLFALARPAPALSDLLLLLAAFAPVPGVTWAVLASLWRRDEELG